VARKIEFIVRKDYPGLDIQVRPILLTEQQCQRYRLPRTPIKETDRGRGRFEDRFGEGATELDALEVLHPGAIEEILTTEIKRYHDDTLSRRLRQFAARKQRELDAINERVTTKYQEQIDTLTSDYEDLVNEYNEEIAELLERRDEIGDAVKDELKAQQPTTDDYDWPEPAEGNEDSDPLLDSTRDYVEQVDRFKRHQDKPTRRRAG
jgi:hypothetical protein